MLLYTKSSERESYSFPASVNHNHLRRRPARAVPVVLQHHSVKTMPVGHKHRSPLGAAIRTSSMAVAAFLACIPCLVLLRQETLPSIWWLRDREVNDDEIPVKPGGDVGVSAVKLRKWQRRQREVVLTLAADGLGRGAFCASSATVRRLQRLASPWEPVVWDAVLASNGAFVTLVVAAPPPGTVPNGSHALSLRDPSTRVQCRLYDRHSQYLTTEMGRLTGGRLLRCPVPYEVRSRLAMPPPPPPPSSSLPPHKGPSSSTAAPAAAKLAASVLAARGRRESGLKVRLVWSTKAPHRGSGSASGSGSGSTARVPRSASGGPGGPNGNVSAMAARPLYPACPQPALPPGDDDRAGEDGTMPPPASYRLPGWSSAERKPLRRPASATSASASDGTSRSGGGGGRGGGAVGRHAFRVAVCAATGRGGLGVRLESAAASTGAAAGVHPAATDADMRGPAGYHHRKELLVEWLEHHRYGTALSPHGGPTSTGCGSHTRPTVLIAARTQAPRGGPFLPLRHPRPHISPCHRSPGAPCPTGRTGRYQQLFVPGCQQGRWGGRAGAQRLAGHALRLRRPRYVLTGVVYGFPSKAAT